MIRIKRIRATGVQDPGRRLFVKMVIENGRLVPGLWKCEGSYVDENQKRILIFARVLTEMRMCA
jgi:hypothetical protein